MRLTIHVLGVEVLHVSTDRPEPGADDPGDCTTYPIGFVARHDVPSDVEIPER